MTSTTTTTSASPPDPAGAAFGVSAASGLSRRRVLAGMGVGALGWVATPSLLGCGSATAAPRPTPRPPLPGRGRSRVAAAGDYAPVGPFTIQASCALSEDYLLTDELLIDTGAGEEVMPFLNTASGLVEAVVLSGGTVCHLRRDPGSVTGWVLQTIDTLLSDAGIQATGAAVTSSSQFNALLVVTGLQGGQTVASLMSLQSASGWQQVGSVPRPVTTPSGPLRAGTTGEGVVYFYGWTEHDGDDANSYDFFQWQASPLGLNPVDVGTLSYPTSGQWRVTGAQLLLGADLPGGGHGDFAVLMVEEASTAAIVSYAIDGSGTFTEVGSREAGAAALIWSGFTAANTSKAPAVVWQTTEGIISFVDETGAQANVYPGAGAGPGQVALWQLNGEFTFAVLEDATMNIVSQFGSGSQSGFTLPIPMVHGIGSVYSLPDDTAAATLFAVDLDSGVSVLTRSATGWTQDVIHRDGPTTNTVTTWQMRLQVTDANTVGVAGGQLQLTPDRPVGLWMDGTGSTYATPDQPTTLTLDRNGKAVACIPTAELDTAQLTAQITNPDGSLSTFTITPDIDVHNYLAGNASLTGRDKLSGQSLIDAQNQHWDQTTRAYVSDGPMMPVLANLSGDQQTEGAKSVADAMNHVVQLGLQPTTAISGVNQTLTDFTGSRPAFYTSPLSTSYSPSPTADYSWWDSVKNDADSAFHALRHGALHVKQLITKWDDKAKHWIATVITDIGDAVDHVMDMVITDIKSAVHAVSSFFQALGADIKAAWNWLKNHVLDLIRDAGANTAVLQGWCGQLSTELTGVLNTVETDINKGFARFTGAANAEIQNLYSETSDVLFGTSSSLPAPDEDSGSNDAELAFKAIGDFFKFLQHSPANWLLHKIEAHLPALDPTGIQVDISAFEQPMRDLVTDITAATSTIQDGMKLLNDAMQDVATSTQALSQSDISTLFGALEQMVDDVIGLLDDLADTVIDLFKSLLANLNGLLNARFPSIPVVSELLDLVGIDISTSIEHLVCLIVAYPTTLFSIIATGEGLLVPTTGAVGTDAVELDASYDRSGAELNALAAVIQFIWAFDDFTIDLAGLDPDNQVSDAQTVIDWVCPMLLTIVQWPTSGGSGQTPWPFANGSDFSDGSWGERSNLLPGVVVTGSVPWVAEALFFLLNAKWGGEKTTLEFINNNVVPVVQSYAGMGNNVLAAMYGYANASTKAEQADAIIAATVPNLSYTFAFLGSDIAKAISEDISQLVKIVVDTFGNFGAVAIDAGQAGAALNG
jgi:hypothetical protein